MQELVKKVINFVKNHPLLTGSLVVLVLFLMCGCQAEERDWGLPNIADVSGIYMITSGFQTIKDSDGEDSRTDFVTSDNILLQVTQSSNAVKLFSCLGILDEDLTVKCEFKEQLDFWGVPGCQHITGQISFVENTAELTMHIDVEFPDIDYTAETEIEAKLVLDSETCSNLIRDDTDSNTDI